jgi:hypothetical protein
MRKQLATLAIAALLGVPFAVSAETSMPSDDQLQPGMIESDRVDTTEVLDSGETIKAEIVEIDRNRASLPRWRVGINLCFSLKTPLTTSASVTSWN